MIIDSNFYLQQPDGDFTFAVDSSIWERVIHHLRDKGISAGGRFHSGDFSDVQVGVDLSTLNEALRDFVL